MVTIEALTGDIKEAGEEEEASLTEAEQETTKGEEDTIQIHGIKEITTDQMVLKCMIPLTVAEPQPPFLKTTIVGAATMMITATIRTLIDSRKEIIGCQTDLETGQQIIKVSIEILSNTIKRAEMRSVTQTQTCTTTTTCSEIDSNKCLQILIICFYILTIK